MYRVACGGVGVRAEGRRVSVSYGQGGSNFPVSS